RNQNVYIGHIIKIGEAGVVIVSSWKPCNSDKVHGKEHPISTNQSNPKMDKAEVFVHHTAKHFWEPVINSCKKTIECRNTHHQMEVSNHKISVMHINVQGAVSHNNSGQPSGNKSRDKTNREQHGWVHLQISSP